MSVRLVAFKGARGDGDSWVNPEHVIAVSSEGPGLTTLTLSGGGKLRVPEDAKEVVRKLETA